MQIAVERSGSTQLLAQKLALTPKVCLSPACRWGVGAQDRASSDIVQDSNCSRFAGEWSGSTQLVARKLALTPCVCLQLAAGVWMHVLGYRAIFCSTCGGKKWLNSICAPQLVAHKSEFAVERSDSYQLASIKLSLTPNVCLQLAVGV